MIEKPKSTIAALLPNKGKTYTNTFMGYPAQRIPLSDKTEDWVKACTLAVSGLNKYIPNKSVTRYKKFKHNFDLINGKINEDDYHYVVDPKGISEKYGKPKATLKSFNLIMSKINYFLDKEYEMPFNFRVYAIDGGGYNDKEEHKKKMFIQMLSDSLKQEMLNTGDITQEEFDDPKFRSPLDIDKYMLMSYEGIRERFLNKLLEITHKRDGLKDKFNDTFKYSLATAEEIMYVGIVHGKAIFRPVNPLFFNYFAHSEIKHIEDSQACSEVRMMNLGQIKDELGDYITDDIWDELEAGNFFTGFGLANAYVQANTIPDSYMFDNCYDLMMKDWYGVPVTFCNWKSVKKLTYVTYLDENNEPQEVIFTEEAPIPKQLKPFIIKSEDQWVTDIWESCMIGNHVIYGHPAKNQIQGKLNYVGQVYNNTNSEAVSIVDMLSPHIKMFNILWLKIEQEFARAGGKKVIMDLSQMPKSQGWSVEQWMAYYDNDNIMWINSAQEGNYEERAKFNQFTSIDMTVSNNISVYFEALHDIERLINDIVGLSPQAMAQIAASETATGINTAISQTNVVTNMWFITHNRFKKRVIEHIIETYKITLSEGTQTINWADELHQQSISIDGGMLGDSDYSLYVSNAVEDQRIFDMLKQQADRLIQANLLSVTDLINIYENNSPSEIKAMIKLKEDQAAANAQQQSQHEQEMAERAQQLEERRYQDDLNYKYEELDRKDNIEQLKLENNLQVEELRSLGFAKDTDINDNGVPDVAEQLKISLEQSKLAFTNHKDQVEARRKAIETDHKLNVETKKLDLESKKLQSDNKNKEEERELARENMKNDEKIARLNKQNRSKK